MKALVRPELDSDIQASDPVALLLRLVDAAEQGAVPPEVASWLRSGVHEYIHCGLTLERALGLSGGARSARYRWLWHQRGQHLRCAWDLLPDELSPYQRSNELARHCRRYVSDVWPRAQYAAEPPETHDAIQRLLWASAKTGLPLPRRANSVHRIIMGNNRR